MLSEHGGLAEGRVFNHHRDGRKSVVVFARNDWTRFFLSGPNYRFVLCRRKDASTPARRSDRVAFLHWSRSCTPWRRFPRAVKPWS